MAARNIVLVGFMGTGKTSVANILARNTGMPMIDMDAVIETRAGKPISRIFAEEGESAFRQYEQGLAAELSTPQGCIISTGGGIVKDPGNIRLLQKGGLVVCLNAGVDEILRRVEHDATRPLLQTPDRRAKVESLLAERAPLYAAIPFQINTRGRTVESIADEILAAMRDLAANEITRPDTLHV